MPVANPRAPLLALLAAVSFLTIVPVGRRLAFGARDVARGAPLFPLVGAALGALAGLTAAALAKAMPTSVAAATAVALSALLTGCIHLDGLADTADALGGRSRERALAIMRDHQIGSFGAVALITTLLIKTTAVATLASRGHLVLALTCAAACARLPAVLLASVLPYARAGDGQGRVLAGHTSHANAGLAVAAAAVIAAATLQTDGLVLLASAGCVALALGLAYRRWLGGVTGDTLGAATELAETAALVVAVGLTA